MTYPKSLLAPQLKPKITYETVSSEHTGAGVWPADKQQGLVPNDGKEPVCVVGLVFQEL